MEKLVDSLGITSLSKSQVSVMSKELDDHVADFRSRPLTVGPYTFVAADALMMTWAPREPVIGCGMTDPMTTALRTQQIERRPGDSDGGSPFTLGATDELIHGRHVARPDRGDRMPVDLRRHVHRAVTEGVGDVLDGHASR